MKDRLTEAMERLASEAARTDPPREIEPVLLAEFDRVRRRQKARSWMISAVAIAASPCSCFDLGISAVPKTPHPKCGRIRGCAGIGTDFCSDPVRHASCSI
jgi:hypothetical protein